MVRFVFVLCRKNRRFFKALICLITLQTSPDRVRGRRARRITEIRLALRFLRALHLSPFEQPATAGCFSTPLAGPSEDYCTMRSNARAIRG